MPKLTLCCFETPRIGSFAGILKSPRNFFPEKHENQNEQEQRQSNDLETRFDSMSHDAVKACCQPKQACHPSAVTAVTNG